MVFSPGLRRVFISKSRFWLRHKASYSMDPKDKYTQVAPSSLEMKEAKIESESGTSRYWPKQACNRLVARAMTEVTYGSSETMSETQDISSHERLEGFVLPRLSPRSNTSLDGTIQDPVYNAGDAKREVELGLSGIVSPNVEIISGEPAAGNDGISLPALKSKTSSTADDCNNNLGRLYRSSPGCKNNLIADPGLDAPKQLVENSSAVGLSTLKTSALEINTVHTSALLSLQTDTSALDNLLLESSVVLNSTESHVVEISAVGTCAAACPVATNLEERSVIAQDSIPGVSRVLEGLEDVAMKDWSADGDLSVERGSLLSTSMKQGQNVSPKFIAGESPVTGIGDCTPLDEIGPVRNSRMEEEVSATNHPLSLFTAVVTEVKNIAIDRNTGIAVGTTEELTEDIGDKLVSEMVDRMATKFADGMANKMSDSIADEIADQIADRMADEIAVKMADGIGNDMADRLADEMAYRMADEMADRMADRMADEMADRMADEMAAEVADELADEAIEVDRGRDEEPQEYERMNDGNTNAVGNTDEEMTEAATKMGCDNYEDDEGSSAEQISFVEELERFFNQRNLEYKAPKFYGLELNVLKLWRVVSRFGGYDHVTVSKLWRTVGEEFKPPKTCTTISWSFRGFYEKALLDYERYKTGVSAVDCSQRAAQNIGCYFTNDERTAPVVTPSSDPNIGGTPGSGSGRARRDAAARAMQGWHSQRMGNGDVKEPSSKDKGSGGKHVKKEKKLTNIGGNGVKRKGSKTVLERAVKAVQARGRPRVHEENPVSNSAITGKRSMKQQDLGRRAVKVAKVDDQVGGFDPPIVDEGPKAEWVKINVHKHLDCFEIYALVPGLAREEVRIQCEPGGRLVIAGMPEDPENPWGVTPFRKVICLPSRIDAHQTSAVVTLYGQLYVRVPIAEDKSFY